MNKERLQELWQERLTGEISDENEKRLSDYLSSNPKEKAELEELKHTWDLFEGIPRPEPSEAMDARFEGMLAAYQMNSRKSVAILPKLEAWFSRGWQVGVAALLIGVILGWWLLPSQNQTRSIDQLSDEIQSMKEMMLLTLIEQPKAQERIRAVNLAAELPNADTKVIEALIMTLNHDENLNVRLASLESLLNYHQLPEVRGALIEALKSQDSPIMIVAIADVLVAIQDKSSLDALEELKSTTEDELIKDKLEESINSLLNI